MQLFEGATTNLEVAVAKGEELSKYSTFSSEQQDLHDTNCGILGFAHDALAHHAMNEAVARERAGYYRQAYMLYMSSAEHSKVCLEHWILMSKILSVASYSSRGNKQARKELMDQTAAELLKQHFSFE
mmetsp:Transcript_20454/g.33151  ORF Transcript_20454/g.33151 Transcript_20454/m.33151 type:complete len:128 (+) Transcript_20454:135-518(+)